MSNRLRNWTSGPNRPSGRGAYTVSPRADLHNAIDAYSDMARMYGELRARVDADPEFARQLHIKRITAVSRTHSKRKPVTLAPVKWGKE